MTGQPDPPDLPPPPQAALAVFAHPDDETFGLGAVLSAFVDAGTAVEGLCFTRGEASTVGPADDLGDIRAAELDEAADEPLLVEVNGHPFARGRLLLTEAGEWAVRIEELLRG